MKAPELILVIGVLAIGGYFAIRVMQGRVNFTNLPGIGPALTRLQYIASPTTPGAIQPKTANKPTPATRAQSSGGGVGGPGYVPLGAPKSNTILGLCSSKCAALKNSPATYNACCKANRARIHKSMKSYMRWSYNATRDRITVV